MSDVSAGHSIVGGVSPGRGSARLVMLLGLSLGEGTRQKFFVCLVLIHREVALVDAGVSWQVLIDVPLSVIVTTQAGGSPILGVVQVAGTLGDP